MNDKISTENVAANTDPPPVRCGMCGGRCRWDGPRWIHCRRCAWSSHSPYCEHPECHARFTAQYADLYRTGTATCPPYVDGTIGSFAREPMVGFRRWCRAHALINEGVAFG